MKQSILLSFTVMFSALLTGQDTSQGFLLSGSVIYEQIDQLNIQLEGDAAQMADLLPRERKSEKILHFTDEASLYENHRTEDLEETMDVHGGGEMMIKMAEPDNKMYIDLKAGMQIEQKEFMSRMFLIESERPAGEWKLTGKQKMIMDYPCQQAVTSDEEKEVVAWFTPSIAVSAGPGRYGNLPGLVLEVNIDEGRQILVAKSIELKALDKGLLEKPTKGKDVTEEEYQAIVEEKLKEMGVEHGGSSGGDHTVVVRIRAN
jgi:GLPGLI family protein